MTEDERAALAALPERVEVYRGVNAFNHWGGLSWTLDVERAEWFARRFADADWRGVVLAGRVLHHRIIALFDARQEREVLVFPRFVYARRLQSVCNPAQLAKANRHETAL